MTPEQLMNMYTKSQLKRMYKDLRKKINDRLYKLGKTEFKRSRTYVQNYGKLPRVRDLSTAEDFATAYRDLEKLEKSGFTSLRKHKQQKAKVLEGLERHGYNFVNESNYWDFYEFMQWFEDNKLKPVYGSPTDEALQTYLDAVKTKTDPEELRALFLEYLEATKGNDSFRDFIDDYY